MNFAKCLAALFAFSTMLTVASAATAATPTAPLPFQPPANWQALPAAFIPRPIVSWQNGLSTFTVSSVALAMPPEQLLPVLKAQSASLGTLSSSATVPVCGESAAELVIAMKSAPQVMTEQVQVADNATYILAYSRPTSAAADASIATTMGAFCGEKSIAGLTPPSDWAVLDSQLVGIWVGSTPTELMTLIASKPQPDTEKLAHDAAQTAFKGAEVTIVSNTGGVLCGLPAKFFTAKVTPNGAQPSLVTMEMTESPTNAYVLLYSHPSAVAVDPAALSSLKTLCANPA